MWLKMFDWFRTFDYTSQYVSLIYNTIIEILPFLLIFLIILFMFGASMYILNSKSDDVNVVGEYTKNSMIDLMID